MKEEGLNMQTEWPSEFREYRLRQTRAACVAALKAAPSERLEKRRHMDGTQLEEREMCRSCRALLITTALWYSCQMHDR